MIQKKVCMVGVHGTGKTSLVQRYVHSLFSAKYHSTVGVKIDRKTVTVDGNEVNLLLWDIEGRTEEQEVPATYLRGAHAVFFVVDGTRRETFDQLESLRALTRTACGEVPALVALNKSDLTEQWTIAPNDERVLAGKGVHCLRTSAKSGLGVEDAFSWLAKATLQTQGGRG